MKYLTIATGIAAGLAAAAFGLAGAASAGPSGPGSASETISQLEKLGNRVIVDRLSDVPLQEASVVSVRTGADVREMAWDADSAGAEGLVYVAVR
ncbi:hypothetical protein [Mycolicibacterium iranicum]|uniref:Uncharacterized protein n=1 Tax=Mycolicibacterium iranicum TaxID=912594 RepID=A0A1X1WVM0_MYCIR|nr:hypothetical protein [Mycolicibacterium iranicum]MCZ0730075.1 hypothetical protein [Mycolicibacterium iranicum]ORV90569.1 hypothetical protein AWC12_07465 [Mycolicibacterium iranicum]